MMTLTGGKACHQGNDGEEQKRGGCRLEAGQDRIEHAGRNESKDEAALRRARKYPLIFS